MAVTVEGAGVQLAVTQTGEGAPVLLIHDIASDAADLAGLASALGQEGARVVAYDRRGYGASGAPEPYEATTVHEQAQDAAAVLQALAGEPAVVCGIGFGALVALDLLTRHPALVRAAVLTDPPLFAFVADAAEELSGRRALLEAALRAGGPEEAVARWLGDQAPPQRVAHARAAHRAFFADVAGLASWPVTRAGLRALSTPTTVLTTPEASRHVLAAADALTTLMPQATRTSDGDPVAATAAMLR